MRLAIDHRTTYRFTSPQARLTQMLRLSPEGTYDQSVTGWHLHVDCDARMRPGRDGFGNRVTMLYVEGPIDSIEIAVAGEVLTNASNGVVHGANEPLPPALCLRTTPLTAASDAIATFAAEAAGGLSCDAQAAANAAATSVERYLSMVCFLQRDAALAHLSLSGAPRCARPSAISGPAKAARDR